MCLSACGDQGSRTNRVKSNNNQISEEQQVFSRKGSKESIRMGMWGMRSISPELGEQDDDEVKVRNKVLPFSASPRFGTDDE